MLRILLILAFDLLVRSDVVAQGFQKLLESAKGGAAGRQAEPSAAEQRNWASEKVSEFQAKEKALDPEMLLSELRGTNLPEARADEAPRSDSASIVSVARRASAWLTRNETYIFTPQTRSRCGSRTARRSQGNQAV